MNEKIKDRLITVALIAVIIGMILFFVKSSHKQNAEKQNKLEWEEHEELAILSSKYNLDEEIVSKLIDEYNKHKDAFITNPKTTKMPRDSIKELSAKYNISESAFSS